MKRKKKYGLLVRNNQLPEEESEGGKGKSVRSMSGAALRLSLSAALPQPPRVSE